MSNCYISPYFPHSSETTEITLGTQTKNQCLETAVFDAAFQGNKTFIALDNNIPADEFINQKNTQTSLKSDIIRDLLNIKCTKLWMQFDCEITTLNPALFSQLKCENIQSIKIQTLHQL